MISIAKFFFKKITWNIPTEEKIIYLTFDDGPTPEITEWTLNELRKFNAKATFFCIGKNVEKYPELFQKIISENHATGNHTYNHLNGWKTNSKDYFQNVKKCNFIISQFLNPKSEIQHPKLFFRPPYGKLTPYQYLIINKKYSIIMWDVLSGDFDQRNSGEKCFRKVVRTARNGSVVVFHDSEKAKKNLFYALPKTLEYFSERGFTFEKLYCKRVQSVQF